MKKHFFSKCLTAASAALLTLSVFGQSEKNVADVEFRNLPPDFENLPFRESSKWNFGFRPYGKESADFLWSDPVLIRDVTSGAAADAKRLPTALYVSMNDDEISFMVYGALKDNKERLKKGENDEELYLECFFLPGGADDPQIVNYQHFGVASNFPATPRWKLSWMRDDRNVRDYVSSMNIAPRRNANGVVLKFSVPWIKLWDKLPIFSDKENNNHWRLSVIRWGGSAGGESWGGVVHSQTKCGYLRMPDFTEEQASLLMKTTLMKLWGQYQVTKKRTDVNPGNVPTSRSYYRDSIAHLPHSWMNINEDMEFVETILKPLIASRDAIGAQIADFDSMTLAEKKAFYLRVAPLLGNFHYDLDEAYGNYIKAKMMKR